MSPAKPLPAPLDGSASARESRFQVEVTVPDAVLSRLEQVCDSVSVTDADRVRGGRDWWPLATVWAAEGVAPALPAAVAKPSDAAQVAAVLKVCHDARIAVTPVAGTSGVCGGSIPLFGGVSLDLTALEGVTEVDDSSLSVEVRAGTFGDVFEDTLRSEFELTLGHWPQSIALSTVGGWVACRGAGQYSTRYGKIEDMVIGLEVALADGRLIHTGAKTPRAATGPDLTQLFVGSEGTLGVITSVRFRAHPVPPAQREAVYAFDDFEAGLDACRRILRRGATPAVLRLYDQAESKRNFSTDSVAVLIVVDEGDPALIDAVMGVVAEECSDSVDLPNELALKWLAHRNQIPDVESLVRAGIVVDTVEIAASWRALPGIYRQAIDRLTALDSTIAASAHQSHAYSDGACLYFTFAGRPETGRPETGRPETGRDWKAAEAYYRQAFDAVTEATIEAGGALSHHHGVGMNRGRYMRGYLGDSFDVLSSVKAALDPHGILNPGKLGLVSAIGNPWEGGGDQ